MHVSFTGAGRDALDRALAHASGTAPHWRPMLKAVRDDGCGLLMVAQGLRPFTVPADPPHVVVIGDDLAHALGPGGFDLESLRVMLAACGAVVVIACEPVVALYREVTAHAVRERLPVAIIETRPEREAEWLAFVRETAAPDVALAIATVPGVGGLQ